MSGLIYVRTFARQNTYNCCGKFQMYNSPQFQYQYFLLSMLCHFLCHIFCFFLSLVCCHWLPTYQICLTLLRICLSYKMVPILYCLKNEDISHYYRIYNRVLKCDVIKMKFLKLWDLSGYSERTMSKRPTYQKWAFLGKLSSWLYSENSIQTLLIFLGQPKKI